jgi:hypothetical protein
LIRVRVCFRCKEFVRIIEKDPNNLNLLNLFDKQHATHPLQVINVSEMDNSYHEISDLKKEISP